MTMPAIATPKSEIRDPRSGIHRAPSEWAFTPLAVLNFDLAQILLWPSITFTRCSGGVDLGSREVEQTGLGKHGLQYYNVSIQ
jgi:hypothetical protein